MIGETYAEYGGSEYAEIFEIGGAVAHPAKRLKRLSTHWWKLWGRERSQPPAISPGEAL